jgi:hypothetical protein
MKVLPSKRWIVVFAHDGQPVEGWMYVHKHKAEEQASKAKNGGKFRVEQVCIISAETMDELLALAGTK